MSGHACYVEDCQREAIRRGLCSLHYQRVRKHGTPDGHSTPRGAASRFYRDVVLQYDGDECLIWPYANVNGYAQLVVDGKTMLVTRLICAETYGVPPPGHTDAAHSCGNGNRGCVTKRHLSWKTRADNMADTFIHGTHLRGERSGTAKLTTDQVNEILALGKTQTQKALADKFGISQQHVSKILRGARWGWLGELA